MHKINGCMINYNSVSALKVFLEQEGLGMRKKFGQNFLINPNARQSLADALGAQAADDVWEIGPGLGAMTALLLEKGLKIKAFEIDPGFINILKNIFCGENNFCLVEGDVMKTWQEQPPAPFLLGNLPYNIAAVLLADFIEKGRIFSRMVVTVQKEVALRMAACAGSKDYSSFSVLCASAYRVKPLALIRRESFYPQPNVDSMGVLFERKTALSLPAVFFPLVRALFASRRKTIKNNLLSFFQNSVSFEKSSGKIVFKADFSNKSKEAFPKAEVLEKPLLTFLSSREMCAAVLRENAIKENDRAENLEFDAFLSLAKSIDNMRLWKKEC